MLDALLGFNQGGLVLVYRLVFLSFSIFYMCWWF